MIYLTVSLLGGLASAQAPGLQVDEGTWSITATPIANPTISDVKAWVAVHSVTVGGTTETHEHWILGPGFPKPAYANPPADKEWHFRYWQGLPAGKLPEVPQGWTTFDLKITTNTGSLTLVDPDPTVAPPSDNDADGHVGAGAFEIRENGTAGIRGLVNVHHDASAPNEHERWFLDPQMFIRPSETNCRVRWTFKYAGPPVSDTEYPDPDGAGTGVDPANWERLDARPFAAESATPFTPNDTPVACP